MKRKKKIFKNAINDYKEINPQNDLENEYENEPINLVYENQLHKVICSKKIVVLI